MKFDDTICPAPLSPGFPTTAGASGNTITGGVGVLFISTVELLVLVEIMDDDDNDVEIGATLLVEVATINEEATST